MFSARTLRSAIIPKRNAGFTTTGLRKEPALAPRGLVPCPPDNYALWAAAVGALGFAGVVRYMFASRKEKILKDKWEEWQQNGFEPWQDFENLRMPKYAKVLAESPCGDSFKEAYMCAIFNEGAPCQSKFGEFVSCVKKVPEMNRDVRPDGTVNWQSKLFLSKLLNEKKQMEDMFASVGPADKDMEDVFNDYRARHILGQNVSEKEVESFKSKMNDAKESFWVEIEGLFDGSRSDGKKADELYRKLVKDYSVPNDVWMQVLKDYDVEEFDELTTQARRSYGFLAHQMKKYKTLGTMRDSDLSNTSCGDKFSKLYKCVAEKDNEAQCADFVDELFFCRENHHKMVWPKVNFMFTPDSTYKHEIERIQEVLTYEPLIN